jgi:hypothetical protein
MMDEDYESIKEYSKRRPRNEVARFILSDLDSAYIYMKSTPPMSNRLTRNVAAQMKSRVALFEGTWLTYHNGTARVPGGVGWPGAKMDYLSNYSINMQSEIHFFLTEAMSAAELIAETVPLATDYAAMFNEISLSNVPEALLWKRYDASMIPAVNHFVVGYLQRDGGGNSGYTRSLVESFLMANGLPIYVENSNYKGDILLENVVDGRDNRLVESMMIPGDLLSTKPSFTINNGYYFRPPIITETENRSSTGYSIKKGLTPDPTQGPTLPSMTACVIFRAAEAYLNYIEANYVRDGNLDEKSQKYWRMLRSRAKVDTDFQKTINATQLEKEPDMAKYSGNQLVDATLYNIRRERRSEFVAEGMRLRDLYRWRSLDNMKNYIVEGFNLWDENYKLYDVETDNIKPERLIEAGNAGANVSARTDSKYIRPYRITTNNLAYNGYNFNQHHYLAPIAYDHFRLTTAVEGSGDISTSVIYQNPGWKIDVGTSAEE